MGKTIKWIILCVLSLIISVCGFVLYLHYNSHKAESVKLPVGLYTVYGIDISAHNDTIDFENAKHDIDFVFIKATEGATWKDRMFDYNYYAAKKSGLKVGAYHFFKFDRSGEAQGVNVTEALVGKDLDFPVVIDIEDHGNPDIKPEIVRQRLDKMVEVLQHHNVDVMFYSNKKGYYKYIAPHYANYPLWICSFTNPPISEKWTFWQYSHEGTISGSKSELDLNVFHSDAEDFESYIEAFKASNRR